MILLMDLKIRNHLAHPFKLTVQDEATEYITAAILIQIAQPLGAS